MTLLRKSKNISSRKTSTTLPLPCAIPPESKPELRSYRTEDRAGVTKLLKNLSSSYPGGDDWLRKRLVDVEKGKAQCTVVNIGSSIIGVAIETPKQDLSVKLSTLFVAEGFRKSGLGSLLITRLKQAWLKNQVASVIGTYDATKMPSLGYFLRIHGFKQIALEKDRYWPGHDEAIVQWTP